MRRDVKLALAAIRQFGPADETIAGDLLESVAIQPSRVGLWFQVASIIAFSALGELRHRPWRSALAICTGWTALLVLFAFGDLAADGLAKLVWGWDRSAAYGGTQSWRPFAVSATMVSYSGFALSAIVVSRLYRDTRVLIPIYAAATLVMLAISAAVIDAVGRATGAVPVPHPLFYVVSVTLPYHWRSGLVFVPLVILGSASSVSSARGSLET